MYFSFWGVNCPFLMQGVVRYHGLETGVQLSEERWFPRQSEDSLLHHGALHVVVLDHDILLQDFDGVQLIRALPLCQHHLQGSPREETNELQSDSLLFFQPLAPIHQHK